MPSLLLSCCYLEYTFWVWMSFYRTYHLHHLVVELFIQQNTPYTCILSTYQNVEHSMFTPLTFHIVVWIKHFVCTTNITKVAQVWCCYDADLQIHAQSSQPGIGKDMCCNEQWDYIMHKLEFKSPTHSSFASPETFPSTFTRFTTFWWSWVEGLVWWIIPTHTNPTKWDSQDVLYWSIVRILLKFCVSILIPPLHPSMFDGRKSCVQYQDIQHHILVHDMWYLVACLGKT